MPHELPELDDYHGPLLERRALPGETRDKTIMRLLIDTLDDGPSADARAQVRGWAEEYAAALADSADPAAAAWAEALEWFAKRTKGGQLSILVHQDFVRRFGVDPYLRPGTRKATPSRKVAVSYLS
ncbi:hypothetical protein OG339_48960 (plasmid) [Streptosporangium sp. NBC_01495]|uniref:hypothetical protein n=1 Tax=Streptosporangium sp. NBC_01495 TaxID=2903899 RepID=UPI002E373D62|nr:hypothetical protein [Streptosporangium sp. NBC_01495]